jgi:hypothetical protein
MPLARRWSGAGLSRPWGLPEIGGVSEPRRTGRSVWGPALCLFAALAVLGCGNSPPADFGSPGPLRAIGPRGPVDWPFDFTWTGTSSDTVVRLHVFDEAERQLYEIDGRGGRIAASQALRSRLKPSTPYLWRVARIDANGHEVDQSELLAFSLRDGR